MKARIRQLPIGDFIVEVRGLSTLFQWMGVDDFQHPSNRLFVLIRPGSLCYQYCYRSHSEAQFLLARVLSFYKCTEWRPFLRRPNHSIPTQPPDVSGYFVPRSVKGGRPAVDRRHLERVK